MNTSETMRPYYEATVVIENKHKSMIFVLMGYEETILSSINEDKFDLILGAESPVEFWQDADLAEVNVHVLYAPSFKHTDADSLPDYLNEAQLAEKLLLVLQA